MSVPSSVSLMPPSVPIGAVGVTSPVWRQQGWSDEGVVFLLAFLTPERTLLKPQGSTTGFSCHPIAIKT